MELTKSEQIRAGLQRSFQSGTSTKASTVRYGYKANQAGELEVDPVEADIVIVIFNHFSKGDSLGKISAALTHMGIASPTGRTLWSREAISKFLANEKYTGDVVLRKTHVVGGIQVKSQGINKQVLIRAHHPAMISHDLSDAVQQEKRKRSRSRLTRPCLKIGRMLDCGRFFRQTR